MDQSERFIPVSRKELVHDLIEGGIVPAEDRELFRKFVSFFSAHLHHRFHRNANQLAEAYRPLSPDRDTVTRRTLTSDERK